MLKKSLLLLSNILVALSLYSCASTSSLQTARTLEKGKSQSTFGVGFYSADDFLSQIGGDDNGSTTKLEIASQPFLEYTHREGLGSNWDAGLRLTILGTFGVDGKYQFIDQEKLAMAVGGGLAYVQVTAGDAETTFIDATVPLYISYDFTESFALYATPRLTYRNISGAVSGSTALIGSSVGLKYGKTSGIYLEGSYSKGLSEDYAIAQTNISYFWDTKGWL